MQGMGEGALGVAGKDVVSQLVLEMHPRGTSLEGYHT